MSIWVAIVVGMELVEMRPAYTMSGSETLAALDALHIEAATRDTYRLELLARLDETGHAKDLGARDTIRLLSMRHRLDATAVRRDLKLARGLGRYEAVTAALPDPHAPAALAAQTIDASVATTADASSASADLGDSTTADPEAGSDNTPRLYLHPAQAEAIVRALEDVPKSAVAVEDLQVAEDQMVKAAQYLSPLDLRKLGRQVRDRLDPDGPEPAEDQAYRRETFWLHNADHGIKFGGFLANENAEALKTAIHALAKPHKTVTGELDPRPRDKRQADALTTLVALAADAGAESGNRNLAMTVTIDYTDLKTTLTAATDGFGELVYGDNLSASAVRRLACDASIIPIVLGSRSEPLDVGTEQRYVTRPIRRALMKRDKGCVVCGAPPVQCEAHHLIHWADGGPTALHNLVLLCKAHHIDLHKGHWNITIYNNTVEVTRPPWADPAPPTAAYARKTNRTPVSCTSSDSDGSSDRIRSTHSAAARSAQSRPVPVRALSWPMSQDIPWITPEEAAHLAPWQTPATHEQAEPQRMFNPRERSAAQAQTGTCGAPGCHPTTFVEATESCFDGGPALRRRTFRRYHSASPTALEVPPSTDALHPPATAPRATAPA